jgi:membrane protease YdiL (CAAX protease family)
VKRASVFFRSVLPGDPAQLLFLFGVVCLFIAPHLRWGPRVSFGNTIQSLIDPRVFVLLALYAIHFAGTAGYFVCFRPGDHPVRRILWLVCLPALIGEFTLIYGCFVYLLMGQASGFEINSISLRGIEPLLVLSKLGPGFHYALVGLVLVAVFTARLALGSASLPLALPQWSVSASDDSISWDGVESFLWVLLALLPLIFWFWFPPVMNFILYYFVFSHLPVFKSIDITVVAGNFVTDSMIVVVAIWIIGREAWDDLRHCLRWPAARGLALGVAFPVGIAALISVGQFLFDLLRAQQSDRLQRPHIGSYFTFPNVELLSLLFLAFSEEIIFRGLLQPRFIRRYGIFRGIFLVGIVFAAAHLGGDFSNAYTGGLVILKLCARLGASLPLCFVAGWLTLRSGAVLPAAVAHGLMNILGSSPLAPTFAGIGPLADLLWAVLAYVLFRYRPVQTETALEFTPENTSPAPSSDFVG